MLFFVPWRKYKSELHRLYEKRNSLELGSNSSIKSDNELHEVVNQIDDLIEGPYAEAVFKYYSERKPNLIRIRTGEVISWEDAFGNSFDKVTKSLRHSIVGLVEEGGRYKLYNNQ